MDPRILEYYNTELNYLREAGAEFAAQYPKVAARLDLRGNDVADPYVERILEGVAFLTARVQLKMDAEFPRFSQRLLETVYPGYLAPTPAVCIVQFQPGEMPGGGGQAFAVPRGFRLRSPMSGRGTAPCEFRTAHDVELLPLSLMGARMQGAPETGAGARAGTPLRASLKLDFGFAAPLGGGQPPPDRLAMFLDASPHIASRLYELLCGHCAGVRVRPKGRGTAEWRSLGPSALQGIGFDDGQALLPNPARGFGGYRLLHEYFAYPSRFHFVELRGLREALSGCEGLTGFEVQVLLDDAQPDLEPLVDAGTFALYCTPAVNLFEKRADRIPVDDSRFELHLVPDRTQPLDYEVHAVQLVQGFDRDNRADTEFRPLYQTFADDRQPHGAYFTLRREPRRLSESAQRQGTRSTYTGSEVFLALVDRNEAPFPARLRQLGVQMTVTNRDLPLLMATGDGSDLVPLDVLPVKGIRIVHGPSRPRSAVADGSINWKLISHLTLGYQGLAAEDPEAGAQRLRRLLGLYAALGDPAIARHVDALLGASLSPVTRRLPGAGPLAWGRGAAIDLSVDEAPFAGASPYLFGAVLERFLARHVSLNSFTETRLGSPQRGSIGRWAPRTGGRPAA